MADKKPAKKVVKKVPTSKKTTTKTKKKAVVKKKTITKKIAPKAITIREKSDEMGLWSRFWRVFTPTFLSKLVAQKSQGKSWGFWFLSNFFLILVPIIAFFVFQGHFFAEFPNNLIDKISDNEQIELSSGETYNVKNLIQNFQFNFNSDGELSSKNIPDPLIFIANEENEEGKFYTSLDTISENFAEFAFILDTKGTLDIENNDDIFANYVYILKDKTIVYDGKKNRTQVIDYKEMLQDEEISSFPKTFNYESLKEIKPFLLAFITGMLLVFAFLIYLFLAVFRLINALIWALVFWAVGAIFGIKNWGFEESFTAMLHFSFVTMLLVPLAFIFDIKVWLYALIVLALLFGMNFWEMKRK